MRAGETPALGFVSWTPHPRAADLASALGAELYVPARWARRLPAPLRYAVQGAATFVWVLRRRLRNVLFTNPPCVAGLPLLLAARVRPLAIWCDSHSGAFNDPTWRRFESLNAWVMRRCAGVLVATDRLVGGVRAAGARPFVVNDPIFDLRAPRRPLTRDAPLLATLGYEFDEPIDELLDAARRCPEMRFLLSGDAPADVRARAPSNCEFSGWLSVAEYDEAIRRARAVICLTRREDTMQRGGYEAVQRGIPLVVSATRALIDWHGGSAVYASSDAASIALACRTVWEAGEAYRRLAYDAVDSFVERSAADRRALAAALNGGEVSRTSGRSRVCARSPQ
jgi:hypothetical protein